MVVAYPSLRKARELHPDATLHFLCFTQIRSSVEMLEIIPSENIITIDAHSGLSLARDTLRFLWRARRRRIDTVINMEAFVRYSSMLSYLSGACRRVGFHRFNQEGLYTRRPADTQGAAQRAHPCRAHVPRSRARARLAAGPGAARETAEDHGLPRGSEDFDRRERGRRNLAEAPRDPCRHRTHPEARRSQSQRQRQVSNAPPATRVVHRARPPAAGRSAGLRADHRRRQREGRRAGHLRDNSARHVRWTSLARQR